MSPSDTAAVTCLSSGIRPAHSCDDPIDVGPAYPAWPIAASRASLQDYVVAHGRSLVNGNFGQRMVNFMGLAR